jgi:hypothetical protein
VGLPRVLLHAVKAYDMGPSRLLPVREDGVLRIFIALKNPSPWPGFEPATFGSSGKHTSHYTTKTTVCKLTGFKFMSFQHTNKRLHQLGYTCRYEQPKSTE